MQMDKNSRLKRCTILLLFFLGVTLATAQSNGSEQGGPKVLLAITGATLIDGTGGSSLQDATILIEGGRIKAVGTREAVSIPLPAEVLEASGKFVIPGLIDSHVHLTGGGRDGLEGALLRLYLAHGVTTVRDLGGSLETILSVRRKVEQGELIGPRIYTSGPILGGSSGPPVSLMSACKLREYVRKLARSGVDLIKIYDSLSPAAARSIIDAAHKEGLRVTGHIPEGMTTAEAAEAGMDGFEHVEFLVWQAPVEFVEQGELQKWLDRPCAELRGGLNQILALNSESPPAKELISLLAARRIALDPLLVTCQAVWFARLGVEPQWSSPLTPEVWLLQREKWRRSGRRFSRLSARERAGLGEEVALGMKRLKELVGACYRAGVPILAGTDGTGWTKPGVALHQELKLLAEAGLSPMAALQAATKNAAEALGKGTELGTVEPGKFADLLILDAHPLEDLSNTLSIHRVMKAGVIYDPQFLIRKSERSPP